MALRGCVLGKKPALPAHGQATDLAIPADGQFALRVRWADPVLHVRARDTGRELAEVTLYELPLAQRGSPLDVRHPGPNAKSLGRAAGPSPIRLDADASSALGLASRVFFAKCPGYAWGRIEVDPKQEEDSTLSLDPSAALELAVVGEAQDTELEVLLLEAEPPHAEVLDVQRGQAKSFVLDDLRPGRYTAEARHSGLLAGTQEIEVRAGERVKAVLQVTQPTAPEVPLEGVLVVPAAWKLDDFMLEFLLQGRFDRGSLSRGSFEIRRSQMELEKGSREVFRWKAPSAVVGRYRLSLFQAHFFAELDTGPTGTRDARIEVPPPCIVALHLVDEESRAEVWSEKATCSVGTSRLMAVLRMGSQPLSSFEFLLPQGRVLLCTTPVSYEAAARLIDAGPGTNDVLLLLKKRP